VLRQIILAMARSLPHDVSHGFAAQRGRDPTTGAPRGYYRATPD
jgi:hypothetical protein